MHEAVHLWALAKFTFFFFFKKAEFHRVGRLRVEPVPSLIGKLEHSVEGRESIWACCSRECALNGLVLARFILAAEENFTRAHTQQKTNVTNRKQFQLNHESRRQLEK